MSEWTHVVCGVCMRERGDDRPETRLYEDEERCCVCGLMSQYGLYVRANPDEMACKGEHDAAAVEAVM